MGGVKTISIIVAANIKGLEKGLSKASGSLRKFASNAARTGSLLSFGVTTPLAALGKQAFDTFSTFENEMTKVKTITGATASEFQMLTEEAKRLGASTQFTAQQVAELQLILGRKGFDPTAIKNMEQSILDLALATGEDLSLAAETVSASINAFGLEAGHAGSIANTLASASANSSVQLSTFATAFGHAGTAAKSVGVDFNELSAMMGVLMDNGIKASKAGTGLRKIFIELAQRGKSLTDGLDEMAKGNVSIIDTSTAVGKTAAAQLKILLDNRNATKELAHEYRTNTGRLKEMSKEMGGTTFAKVKKMQSAIEGLKLEFGALLADMLLPIIKKITELANKFTNLDDNTKRMILTCAGIAAALGPALLAIGALASLVSPLGLAITGVAAAIGALSVASSDNRTELEKQQTAMNNLADRAMSANEGTEKRIKLIQELQKEYPSLLENLDAEKVSNEDIKKALDQANESFLKKIRLQAESEKLQELMNEKSKKAEEIVQNENKALEGLRDAYKDSGKKINEFLSTEQKLDRFFEDTKITKFGKGINEFFGTLKDATIGPNTINSLSDLRQELDLNQTEFDEASQALEDYLKLLEEIGSTAGQVDMTQPSEGGTSDDGSEPDVKKPWWEKLFGDDLTKKLKDSSAKIKEFFKKLESDGQTGAENLQQLFTGAFGALGAIFDAQLAKQEQADQERYDREIARLEGSSEFAQMTEEQKQDAIAKIEQDSFEKTKKIKKKQAKLEKAQAIFGAIVNTLASITKALPNLALAQLVGAFGFMQVAAISSTPIPKFADGGIVSGPTIGMMGEYQGARTNPEVIAPLDKLRSMMGSVDVNVNVTGHLDAEGIQIATVRGNDIARQTGGRSFNT